VDFLSRAVSCDLRRWLDPSETLVTPNLQAFLAMIAVSEGTAAIGDRGYNCIVGSRAGRALLFTSYADHPRIKVQLRDDDPKTLRDEALWSTAAGRYQILARYYDAYKKSLALPDFTPASQDKIAIQMIREQKALDDIEIGRLVVAIDKCKNIWASLPGAGYGQGERSLDYLSKAYVAAGGALA
jgi:muramidase (phage lysozyme)